ncbi:MAG TPA: hypothetical protein VHE30_09435 [Polyangiaceae bacterium]|nr:hypothetical protein [Polyangiaceae bacterium]
MSRDDYRPTVALGVLTLSAASMTTELVLTRLFSVVIWYHFAFFAISVALFGASVAGVLVFACRERLDETRTSEHLALASGALSVAVVFADLCLSRVVPYWFDRASAGDDAGLGPKIALVALVLSAPFFAGGFAMALAVRRYRAAVHRLYAVDLLGAAASCVLVVPLLGLLGGPAALLAGAALSTLAAFFFGRTASRGGLRGVALGGAGVLLGVVLLGTGMLDATRAKQIDLRGRPPEFDAWNAFSRVTVVPFDGFRGWGTSPTYRGPVPEQKGVFIDMGAFTVLTRLPGAVKDADYASYDLSAFVFRLRPSPSEVCVVGAGGGKDILAALQAGARRVTAAEINPLIVDGVVRGRFRDFTGDLYRRPDVDVHVEDGRSFVRRTDRRFDVLLLSMVDTSAATGAGAFSLTENTLYTVEAFADFLDRLGPDGILSVSSVSLPKMAVGARLVSVARAALERRGVDPSRALAVLTTPWVHTEGTMFDVLVKPSGFSESEVQRIGDAADALRFHVAWVPGLAAATGEGEGAVIHRIAAASDAAVLRRDLDALPLDTTPATDDRPFFFYQDRASHFLPALAARSFAYPFGDGLVVLSKVLVVTALMAFASLGLPLLAFRKALASGGGSVYADSLFVGCLGFGFMAAEIGALQRLATYLGHPTYTLAVVLASLLLSTAVGSRFLSARVAARPGAGVAALLGCGVLVLVTGIGAPAGLALVLGAPVSVRALACAASLVPLGVLLGAPFAAGLRAVAGRAEDRLPFLFAANGATSVLGSVVATLVSLHVGITATLGVAAASYGLAAALAPVVFRPARGAAGHG